MMTNLIIKHRNSLHELAATCFRHIYSTIYEDKVLKKYSPFTINKNNQKQLKNTHFGFFLQEIQIWFLRKNQLFQICLDCILIADFFGLHNGNNFYCSCSTQQCHCLDYFMFNCVSWACYRVISPTLARLKSLNGHIWLTVVPTSKTLPNIETSLDQQTFH